MITSLVFTDHAAQRMIERNLKTTDVYYVCEHGTWTIKAGAIHIFLGMKNIPEEDRKNDRITRLVGTTVLLDSHDAMTVKTAYRNRESTKKDRRKTKYDKRKSSQSSSVRQLPLAA